MSISSYRENPYSIRIGTSCENLTDSQKMGEQEEDTSKKMQSIHDAMSYSLLSLCVDNTEIQKADPDAYTFLKTRKEEFIKLRDSNYERMSLSKQEVKKQALPFMGFLSGLGLFCSFPIAGAGMLASSLVMGSGLSISVGSGFVMISTACRLQEHDADDRAILNAKVEQLKGGLRFFKACQNVERDRVQDPSSGFFNRVLFSGNKSLKGRILSTISDESWRPNLAVNPSWKDRIAKIEKRLQDLGEKNIATQTWEIQRLEELIKRFIKFN